MIDASEIVNNLVAMLRDVPALVTEVRTVAFGLASMVNWRIAAPVPLVLPLPRCSQEAFAVALHGATVPMGRNPISTELLPAALPTVNDVVPRVSWATWKLCVTGVAAA
jgi:hypothetical protein